MKYTDKLILNGVEYQFAEEQQGWQPGANTILYLPFEDDLLDHSGNNYTIYNGGTAPTKQTLGYEFGTNNNQYLYSENLVNPIDCITYSFFMNWQDASNDGVIILKKHISNSSPYLYTNILAQGASRKVFFEVNTNNGTKQNQGPIISLNTWYHVVCVYDGTNTYIYLNGNLINTLANVGTLNSGNTTYYIGSFPTFTQIFRGYLSKLIVEHSAWTQQEVQDYFDKTKSLYGIS